MTQQYFAFAWPVEASDQAARAKRWITDLTNHHGWVATYQGRGLCVLHKGAKTEADAILLPREQGVVLGTLFLRGSEGGICTRVQALPENASVQPATTTEEMLVQRYWGRYVAFYQDNVSATVNVLRDPSGGFPCFRATIDGVSIFVSNVSDLATLKDYRPDFNWRYVIETFYNLETVAQKTGLSNLIEVLPGEMLVLESNTEEIMPVWSPQNFIAGQQPRSLDEAAERTRGITEQCVNSWANLYGPIFHNLSGGFDSAVVLASMAEAEKRPDVTCVNYYTMAAAGDERTYARAAAEKAGYEMIDLEMPVSFDLPSLVAQASKTGAPTGDIFSAPTAEALVALAQQLGSEAFFSGEGGDHLFYELKTPLVTSDYIRSNGFSKKTLSVMLDAAHFTGQSFWHVLRETLRHQTIERQKPPLPDYPAKISALLKDGVRAEAGGPYPLHHWVNDTVTMPPGKWIQIFALLQALQRRKSPLYSEVAEVRNPLLSQPLMELCLSIPSYMAISGGQGRAVARRAFENSVPREILKRRVKGTTESYFHELLKRNQSYVEDMILDGHLVREAKLDKEKTLAFIRTRHFKDGEAIRLILRLVATEAWMNAWD